MDIWGGFEGDEDKVLLMAGMAAVRQGEGVSGPTSKLQKNFLPFTFHSSS